MKNMNSVLKLNLLLFLAITFSTCNNSCNKKVIIYYDHSIYGSDSSNEDQRYRSLISDINNLAEHLNLDHKFSLSEIKNLPASNFDDYFATNIDPTSSTFHVYVESETPSGGLSPYYNTSKNYFYIPNGEKNNPMVWLHEFNHKIAPISELHHISKTVEGEENCNLNVEGRFCLNLMSRIYYTAFGFLLTEYQVDIINGKKKECSRLFKHAYPTALIEDNIEQLIKCCWDPQELTREEIITLLGLENETDYAAHIMDVIDLMQDNDVCITQDGYSDIELVDEVIKEALEINPDTISTYRAISDIMRIVKLRPINSIETQKLFEREAKYLSEELGFEKGEIYDIRLKSYISNLQNAHIKVNEILEDLILQRSPEIIGELILPQSIKNSFGPFKDFIDTIAPSGRVIFHKEKIPLPTFTIGEIND